MIDRPAERFSGRADAYAQSRPAYPSEVLDALLDGLGPPNKLTIADIGAGTGIASRLLAERGATVFAVEPNHSMAERAQPDPRIEWIDGTAEDTCLPSQSVDMAAAFQAFHWFDPPAAIAEFKRISRRRIALVQYERDERDDFTGAYGNLVRRFAIESIEGKRAETLATFPRLAGPNCVRSEHPFSQSLDRDALLGRMSSTSYLPRDGPRADEMRVEASELFERFARNGSVSIAMICYVMRCDA